MSSQNGYEQHSSIISPLWRMCVSIAIYTIIYSTLQANVRTYRYNYCFYENLICFTESHIYFFVGRVKVYSKNEWWPDWVLLDPTLTPMAMMKSSIVT